MFDCLCGESEGLHSFDTRRISNDIYVPLDWRSRDELPQSVPCSPANITGAGSLGAAFLICKLNTPQLGIDFRGTRFAYLHNNYKEYWKSHSTRSVRPANLVKKRIYIIPQYTRVSLIRRYVRTVLKIKGFTVEPRGTEGAGGWAGAGVELIHIVTSVYIKVWRFRSSVASFLSSPRRTISPRFCLKSIIYPRKYLFKCTRSKLMHYLSYYKMNDAMNAAPLSPNEDLYSLSYIFKLAR